ncbi:LysR family transcriptional regulator [Brucella sp. C7-11G]
MELKWLEDFVTLADNSSFSRSAELRNVTQPAFSRRIKQLEVWLGAPLITRGTMPAELTPAGRNFLPLARDTIRTLYAAQEALRPTTDAGMARFAALHTLTVTFVPAWLQLLEQEISDLRISLIPDRGGIEANLATLVDGEADFFLTYAHRRVPFHLDRQRFDFLSVGSDRLVPVAAPQVRLQRNHWVPGEGLLDRAVNDGVLTPYLSYGFSSFFGVALGRLFAERPQFPRRQVHENAISAGLKTVALTGAGLCWLPQSLIQAELDAGLLLNASRTTDWTMDLEIRLYRHLGNKSKLVKNFWKSAEGQSSLNLIVV